MTLLPPEQDLQARQAVWLCMQDLFLDADPTCSYPLIIDTCQRSAYSPDELEAILFNEVLPALAFNLFTLFPEWAGFEPDWLVQRILRKHRYGRAKPRLLRAYTQSHWDALKPAICAQRRRAD